MGSFPVETIDILKPLDPEQFRKQAHLVVDFLADYYSNIEKYPVCSQVKPGFLTETMPDSPPFQPASVESILQDVQKHILPGFNTVGFNWLASPAATELEMVVMEWLLKILQLPKSFSFSSGGGGVIHGSTCESFICTLVAAREKKLNEFDTDNREVTLGKLVVYCSDQTHFL